MKQIEITEKWIEAKEAGDTALVAAYETLGETQVALKSTKRRLADSAISAIMRPLRSRLRQLTRQARSAHLLSSANRRPIVERSEVVASRAKPVQQHEHLFVLPAGRSAVEHAERSSGTRLEGRRVPAPNER